MLLLFLLLAAPAWADGSLAPTEDRLRLVGLDGGEVELQPAEGQTLLLHFWATWCPTCLGDILHLQSAAATCSSERVRVVLVNVGEAAEVVREFVKKHDVLFPVLRDPKGRLWRRSGGRGLPANLFWSSDGKTSDVDSKTETQWQRILASRGCSTSSR